MDANQVDDIKNGDVEGSSSDDSLNGDSEEYDADIKDDVLRPASTRSKIVVNLSTEDGYKYHIDAYDKVRMKLILPNEKLYKAYEHTISKIESNKNF